MFNAHKYQIVEPGANPMDDGRPVQHSRPLLWILLLLGLAAGIIFGITRLTGGVQAADDTPTPAPTYTVTPEPVTITSGPTARAITSTPAVIIRTVIVPQYVSATKIVDRVITRIVPVQQTVMITQLITATQGPTQTPWIITVPVTVTPTPTETPTETPTITPTAEPTETPTVTPTETPTDQVTPTPTETPNMIIETPLVTPQG